MEAAVRVEVDRDACEANAVCQGLVPEVFEVDEKVWLELDPRQMAALEPE